MAAESDMGGQAMLLTEYGRGQWATQQQSAKRKLGQMAAEGGEGGGPHC
jgi:hypothetical protein